MARANNLAYQQQNDAITRSEIDFNQQQQNFMAQMQAMQQQAQIGDQQDVNRINMQTQRNNQQFQLGVQERTNQFNRQAGEGQLAFSGAGRNLNLQGQDLQADLGRRQLMGNQLLQSAGEDAQLQTALQQEQLQFQQNLRGLVDNFDNARIGANANQIGAESEALQGSRELNRLAQDGTREVEGAEQARGNNLQALSGGDSAGISDSARLLANSNLNEAQRNALERRMVVNEGQSILGTNLELSRSLADFARTDARRNLVEGARGLSATREIAESARNNQRTLSQFGREFERQNFENTAGVNRFLSSMGNDLAGRQERYNLDQQSRMADFQLANNRVNSQFNLGQQERLFGIQNDALDRSRQMSQSEREYMILQAALDAGMENQALDILQQARVNTNLLDEQAALLNSTMSDIAFSQNAFSTINTGRSEINALAAQRNSIQRPGFLSYANAGLQAAGALQNIFVPQPQMGGMGQQQQPQYGFANQGFGTFNNYGAFGG